VIPVKKKPQEKKTGIQRIPAGITYLAYKYKDIQSKYDGNLDKLQLFRKCKEVFDMFGPFLIPLWNELDAISVLDHWGNRKRDAVNLNLTTCWSKVLLEACLCLAEGYF
jgi:hypothetical protein